MRVTRLMFETPKDMALKVLMVKNGRISAYDSALKTMAPHEVADFKFAFALLSGAEKTLLASGCSRSARLARLHEVAAETR